MLTVVKVTAPVTLRLTRHAEASRVLIREPDGNWRLLRLAYLRMRARHKLNEWRHSHLKRDNLSRNYDCVGLARRLGFE